MTSQEIVSLFTEPDRVRFWRRVSVGPVDACWPYRGAADKDGYGKFQIKPASLGKQIHLRSHRVAHWLSAGPCDGLVLHSCDNPPCCNPRHLRSGSQRENIQDAIGRGRRADCCVIPYASRRRGEAHPYSKLTGAIVREARQRRASGESISGIARALGLPRTPISNAILRKTWKHL